MRLALPLAAGAFALAALLFFAAPAATAASHAPIRIASDIELLALAAAESWPGDGTAASPYVLQNVAITAAGAHGIEVSGTRLHLAIRGVSISSGGGSFDAVRLVDARNVSIENSTFESSRHGVFLKDVTSSVVANSTMKSSQVGLLLDGATNVTIRDNRLSVNEKDLRFARSWSNVLQRNNLSTATGQFGLHFDDDLSYGNQIDTSNVVNSIPLRWYSGLRGTAEAPIAIAMPTVDLRGATNVAQIMIHNSTHVLLDRPVAKGGAASGWGNGTGIHVHTSSHVNITSPNAEGNAGAGIAVTGGDNVSVWGGTLRANARGGAWLSGTTDAAIVAANVSQNGERGVFLDASRGARIEGSGLFANGEADVHAQQGSSATVRQNTMIGPSTTGVRLVGSSATIVSNVMSGHAHSIRFTAASGSVLSGNDVWIQPGQIGLQFDADDSYNHSIDATNTVNGVPVRWYTNVRGTEAAPVVLPSVTVDVRGITNVAQVMVHASANVTLPNATALHGVATGILVHASERVNVSGPRAEGNALTGVQIARGRASQVVEGQVRANGDHGVRVFESPSATIQNNAIEQNLGRGVSIERAELATLRGNGFVANRRSAVFLDQSGPGPAVFENNVATGNTAGGFFADRSAVGSVAGNNISGNVETGIHIASAPSGARVENNTISNHTRGIRLAQTSGAELHGNRIARIPGQFGLWLDDETSYDNQIPPTNTVDGVPLRWYVRANGSSVTAMRVEIPGITNVAQAMVYLSRNVTLTDPVLANGTARGLYVLGSDNVTVGGARIEANAQDGLHASGGSALRVHNATLARNLGRGLHASAALGLRVENVTIAQNADVGLLVTQTPLSGPAVVLDSTLRGNRGGATLDRAFVSAFSRNALDGNGEHGLHVVQTSVAMADNNTVANHTRGVQITKSPDSRYASNRVTIFAGQTGFHFSDTDSYAVNADPTNLVNGVPLRWYSACAGTEAAPLVLSGIRVELRGITNVAQVMLRNCRDARVEDAVVGNGSAAGIHVLGGARVAIERALVNASTTAGVRVESSSAVVMANTTVRDGAGHGVHATRSLGLDVAGTSLLSNAGDGILSSEDSRPAVRNVTARLNGGNGIRLDRPSNALVENASIESSGLRGISLEGATGASLLQLNDVAASGREGIAVSTSTGAHLRNNTATSNGIAGILLDRQGAGTLVEANRASNNPKGIRLVESAYGALTGNRVTMLAGQTGFHFDDEASFQNAIPLDNLVNGEPVRWYTTLAGTETNPIVIADARTELRGITNVAQVMVYKSAYVKLVSPIATNGTNRGVYLFGSSSVTLEDGNLSGNKIGLHLHQTQSSLVRNVTLVGSTQQGALVTSSQSNALSRLDASSSPLGLSLDAASRDNRVQDIEVADRGVRAVLDPTVNGQRGSNLVADAGAAKRGPAGTPVALDDNVGAARYDGERIVSQRWDFGDGQSATSALATLLRPSHAYATPGSYRAAWTIVTADGQTLRDNVTVEIVPPLSAPGDVVVSVGNANATLSWSAPAFDGGLGITSYRVYRGPTASALAPIATVGNVTSHLDAQGLVNGETYAWAVAAVTSAGEGPRSAVATAIPATTPRAPTALVATGGARNATLQWFAPTDTGGLPILHYRILRGADAEHVTWNAVASTISFVDDSLVNGRRYAFAVQAVNALGAGETSTVAFATPESVPDAPANVTLMPGDSAVLMIWDAPTDTGGLALSGYRVYRGVASGDMHLVATLGNVTDYRDAGLLNDRAYVYAISAVNARGEGNRSAPQEAIPRTLDTLRPVILLRTPAEGARVLAGDPEIGARLVDNVGVVAARLWVDGVEVTVNATLGDTSISYRPVAELAAGNHTVRVLARDAAGNEAVAEWSFRVLANEERVPVLRYVNLTVAPSPAEAGQVVVARVRVENVGLAPANLSLALLVDGVEAARAPLFVRDGEWSEAEFEWLAVGTGIHTLSVEDANATIEVLAAHAPAPGGWDVEDAGVGAALAAAEKENEKLMPWPGWGALGALAAGAAARRRFR